MPPTTPQKIAVIGAGLAGATCAQALAVAGCSVHLVDKARGPGGRLATRRLEWTDAQGQPRSARVDHGAPGFTAQDPAFQAFLQQGPVAAAVRPWAARLAAGSRPLRTEAGPLQLPVPDMPALCRALLHEGTATGAITTCWSFAADTLTRQPEGWHVAAQGTALPGHFDAVLLALPPAQAAPLLAAHKPEWAQRASIALMQPCWTLMGVATRPTPEPTWSVARPDHGPLAWVLRNEAKPGRDAAAGLAHWVVHARASWSRQHLEHPADEVKALLQAALARWLGEAVSWHHAVVHRWRYALPASTGHGPVRHAWWSAAGGLGVCGDFLGGTGVEGAWLSAQALVAQMRQPGPGAGAESALPSSD
jgi:predicted NAD/FAD-dependent oxidoreductase